MGIRDENTRKQLPSDGEPVKKASGENNHSQEAGETGKEIELSPSWLLLVIIVMVVIAIIMIAADMKGV